MEPNIGVVIYVHIYIYVYIAARVENLSVYGELQSVRYRGVFDAPVVWEDRKLQRETRRRRRGKKKSALSVEIVSEWRKRLGDVDSVGDEIGYVYSVENAFKWISNSTERWKEE